MVSSQGNIVQSSPVNTVEYSNMDDLPETSFSNAPETAQIFEANQFSYVKIHVNSKLLGDGSNLDRSNCLGALSWGLSNLLSESDSSEKVMVYDIDDREKYSIRIVTKGDTFNGFEHLSDEDADVAALRKETIEQFWKMDYNYNAETRENIHTHTHIKSHENALTLPSNIVWDTETYSDTRNSTNPYSHFTKVKVDKLVSYLRTPTIFTKIYSELTQDEKYFVRDFLNKLNWEIDKKSNLQGIYTPISLASFDEGNTHTFVMKKEGISFNVLNALDDEEFTEKLNSWYDVKYSYDELEKTNYYVLTRQEE